MLDQILSTDATTLALAPVLALSVVALKRCGARFLHEFGVLLDLYPSWAWTCELVAYLKTRERWSGLDAYAAQRGAR